MADTKNVTYGKPKVAGALSVAKAGSKIPTDAKSELDEAYKNLGYISDDGLANENTAETDLIKAWGGDSVLTLQTSKTDTFAFTLIEVMNMDVLKTVYGESNVTGDLTTGIKIVANSKPLESKVYVFDIIFKGGILKRIVIPNGQVTEVGEISYKDDEAVGYETTVQALPDKDGNTHYEYIVKEAQEDTL